MCKREKKEFYSQPGVKLVLSDDGKEVVDIDVGPNIKALDVLFNLNMPNTEKTFPEVCVLNIKDSNVDDIVIPNSLFPNVKYVRSNSKYFQSENCLIKKDMTVPYGGEWVLTNSFCKDAGEIINVSWAKNIKAFAFSGCRSTNLIYDDTSLIHCDKDAFKNSAFEKQPFVNGVKMAGPIVIDIDESMDTIDLPDGDIKINAFNVDISNVKNMISHSDLFLKMSIKTFPQNLVIDSNSITLDNIRSFVFRDVGNTKYIQNLRFSDKTLNHLGLKIVNNTIYSKDMEVLVAYYGQDECVDIPNTVKVIDSGAFHQSHLKSVVIPDSVEMILDNAFHRCEDLKSVILGKNLRKIGKGAFCCSGLQYIKFNDKLEVIRDGAFAYTKVKEFGLPLSIIRIEDHAFGNAVTKISIQHYNPDIIRSLTAFPQSNGHVIEFQCEGKTMYITSDVERIDCDDYVRIVDKYFLSKKDNEYYSSFKYSQSKSVKECLALLEFSQNGNPDAVPYLKRYSREMLLNMINDDNEAGNIMKLLSTGLVSKRTLNDVIKADNIN